MIGEYLHAGLCVWVVGRLEPANRRKMLLWTNRESLAQNLENEALTS
jgi:hypothetical protein